MKKKFACRNRIEVGRLTPTKQEKTSAVREVVARVQTLIRTRSEQLAEFARATRANA